MSLVAENQPDLPLVQDFGVKPERFVGDDENGVDGTTAERVHEAVQVSVNVRFGAGVDGQGRDALAQPFADLVVPVLQKNKRNIQRPEAVF